MYCIHRQYRRWSTSKNFFLKGHQGAIAVVTKKLRSVLYLHSRPFAHSFPSFSQCQIGDFSRMCSLSDPSQGFRMGLHTPSL